MRLLAALLLTIAATAAAGPTTQRSDGHPARTFAISIYTRDFYFDVDGDIQDQIGPRTCGTTVNPSTGTVNQCLGPDFLDPVQKGGWVPDVTTCATGLECLDPGTGVNRCAGSPYCLGGSWQQHGLAVIDLQNRVHKGLDSRSPFKAAFVIQVGDMINMAQYCSSWSRADACSSSANVTDACTGGGAGAAVKAEIYAENTNLISRYIQPLIDAKIPVAATHGNHDHLGCWETRIKPLVTAQPGFVTSAADGTKLDTQTTWSMLVPTPVGSICIVNYGYAFYESTIQNSIPLVGCGVGRPTIVNSHTGSFSVFQGPSFAWWQAKGSFTTAQMIDRTGHPEVWLNTRGHTQPNELFMQRILGANTNSGQDIFDLKSDFQWSSYRGGGDSTFGGAPYDGVTNPDGSGGEIVRCRVSPARQTLECLPYNPIAQKYGTWDYASTGYGGLTGYSFPLDWCTRFGC